MKYTCVHCGGVKEATVADMNDAFDRAFADPAFREGTESTIFRDYGRDECDVCVVRSALLSFDRMSTVALLTQHGARIS